jgi:DNA repair exonuclease SbcCD ATPase subunit
MSPAAQPSDSPAAQPDAQLQSETRPVQILREGGGNLDKIRDILFGTQMRGYEARFAALEEALAKETAEIRETSRRRFEQLESYVKKELELLQTRWKAERDERSDAAVQHSRELREMGESLSRRLRDLDERGTAVERDLRSQLLQQAKDLSDDIQARHEAVGTLLEKRFQELRQGKTDRAALASLFNEVALRLNDQFQIPGADS